MKNFINGCWEGIAGILTLIIAALIIFNPLILAYLADNLYLVFLYLPEIIISCGIYNCFYPHIEDIK